MIDNNSYARNIKNKLRFLSLISKKKKKLRSSNHEPKDVKNVEINPLYYIFVSHNSTKNLQRDYP